MVVSVCHASVAVEPTHQSTPVESQGVAMEPTKIIQRLECGEKVTIVTMGTSLTGGTWRWVDVMKAWLDRDYPEQVTIKNLGVGASASMTVPAMKGNKWTWKRCGLDRIPQAIAAKPDVVFIEFATNDAFKNYGISVKQSRQNLESMISQLQKANPKTDVILMTMNIAIGKHGNIDRPNQLLYQNMYRDVATAKGLRLVDCYPAWEKLFKENPDLFRKLVPDGIHPQLPGYREILLPILQKTVLGESLTAHLPPIVPTLACTHSAGVCATVEKPVERLRKPNIILIMADDHTTSALSCYGSQLINTPHLDKLASQGTRFANTFCGNAICGPSRATILTGKQSHIHGSRTNYTKPSNAHVTYPELLKKAGYQTALIGKTHHWINTNCTKSMDHYIITHGAYGYENPKVTIKGIEGTQNLRGYLTDVMTDQSMAWIMQTDPKKPFMLMLHHPAPHMPFQGDEKLKAEFKNTVYPEPASFSDPAKNGQDSQAPFNITIPGGLMAFQGRVHSLGKKAWIAPKGLEGDALKEWVYQKYMREYMNCIRSIDNNAGRLMEFLKENGLDKNTVVIYTSDQGFFLGEHGWYDKRFIYEESLRLPLIVRYPGAATSKVEERMTLNLDYAQTFLDIAGVKAPSDMQGTSLLPLIRGEQPKQWRTAIYNHYFEDRKDSPLPVQRHYGIRTKRYKLIHFYGGKAHWELFDLKNDPIEMKNLYDTPEHKRLIKDLKAELVQLREKYKDNEGPAVQ